MELDLMFLKKTPPQSLEAERAVLGGILVQKENLNVVLSTISPDDLYKDAHRRILEAITALVDKGLPVDLLSLTEELQRAGILEDVGGAAYLSGLLDGVPRNLNVEYYAQIIKEKALLRRLILSSAKIISESYEQKEDADELLNAAQAAIVEVAEQRLKPGFQSMNVLMPPTLDMIQTLVDRKEAVTGVPTGFRDLDNLTAGDYFNIVTFGTTVAPFKPDLVQATSEMVAQARAQGKRWKLVCTAEANGNTVKGRVAPELVDACSPLYSVEGSSSFVEFHTDTLSSLGIVEGNPGPETTAYGLLSDFINAVRSW